MLGLCAAHEPTSTRRVGGGQHVTPAGHLVRKAVRRHIDPGDRHARQRAPAPPPARGPHAPRPRPRAAAPAAPPAPPSSPAPAAGAGALALPARPASRRFTASGIARPSTAARHDLARGQGRGVINLGQQRSPPRRSTGPVPGPAARGRAAAPARCQQSPAPAPPPAHSSAPPPMVPDCPSRPDQHRRPDLARGRAVDRRHHHPRHPALRRNGVAKGAKVKHRRAAVSPPSAPAPPSRARPAPDRPTRRRRPPPHPTAPSAPRCPA